MSYREALKRLEAYEPKRLTRFMYFSVDEGCHCALGAVVPGLPGDSGSSIMFLAFEPSIEGLIREVGMSLSEAFRLQRHNDWCTEDLSDEERYESVLAFLRAEVAKEST